MPLFISSYNLTNTLCLASPTILYDTTTIETTVYYTTHNNKWDFYVVRASLNVSARVAKSSIYFCE